MVKMDQIVRKMPADQKVNCRTTDCAGKLTGGRDLMSCPGARKTICDTIEYSAKLSIVQEKNGFVVKDYSFEKVYNTEE